MGKFVRIGVKKLFKDYEFKVAKIRDVSKMAVTKYQDKALKRLGLERL